MRNFRERLRNVRYRLLLLVQRIRAALSGGSSMSEPNPMQQSSGMSFTRASGATVTDHQGWIHHVGNDELRMQGMRRTENLITDPSGSADWSTSGGVTITKHYGVSPNGYPSARIQYDGTGSAGNYRVLEHGPVNTNGYRYANSLYIRNLPGSGITQLRLHGNVAAGSYKTIDLTEEWQLISDWGTGAGASVARLLLYAMSGNNDTWDIEIAEPMMVADHTATITSPGEFVPKGLTYFGENQVSNPEFSGFVSGTPGTSGPSWGLLASDGSINVNGSWVGFSVTAGRQYVNQTNANFIDGKRYRISLDIRNATINFNQLLVMIGVTDVVNSTPAGSVPTDGTHHINFTAGPTTKIRIGVGVSSDITGNVEVRNPVAREYIEVTDHGWGADGVAYFDTDADGVAIPDSDNKGALLERTRTNLIADSEGDLTSFPTKSGFVSGTLVGFDAAVETSGDGTATIYAYKSVTYTPSADVVISVFVEMADGSEPVPGNSTSVPTQDFRLIVAGSGTNNVIVEHIRGGLYRVQGQTSLTSTPGGNTGVVQYAANSGKHFTISGISVEEDSLTASSYIKTSGGSATRSDDLLSWDDADDEYDPSNGVYFIDATALSAPSEVANGQRLMDARTADGSTREILYNPSSLPGLYVASGGVAQRSVNFASGWPWQGERVQLAWQYTADSYKLYVNGVLLDEYSGLTWPAVVEYMNICQNGLFILKNWGYYPGVLTEEEILATFDNFPAAIEDTANANKITITPDQSFTITEDTEEDTSIGTVLYTGLSPVVFTEDDDRFGITTSGNLSIADYSAFTENDYPVYKVQVAGTVNGYTDYELIEVVFPDGAVFDEDGNLVTGPDGLPIYVVV